MRNAINVSVKLYGVPVLGKRINMNKCCINYEEFTNCLRILIVPDEYQDERIEEIKNFCLKYSFKNVMLFLNNEDFFVGHMTEEEAKPWVEVIKKAKKVFNSAGISVSLNYWISMGHQNRGRTLKNGQNFRLMKGIDGDENTVVVCPLDENWKKYFSDFVKYLVKEIEPCVYWVEDDFRLHNHDIGRIGFFGCFCDEHIKKFNEILGKEYSREQYKKFLYSAKPNHVRDMWMDFSRKTMNDLSKFIGDTVKSCGTDTEIGLMSSGFYSHAIENRDWKTIASNFTVTKPIHRLTLSAYHETSPKEYYYDFNASTMANRALLPEDSLIYPELENGSYSTFVKDKRFLRFQCESALPLVLSGFTYNIFEFAGNGVNEGFGYGQTIREFTPYMSAVTRLKIKYGDLRGIIVPIFEDVSKYLDDVKDFWSMIPLSSRGASYLSALGVSYKYCVSKVYNGETVLLFGETVNCFTDDELINLFENNFVIIEGSAAYRLYERGLGYLFGAKSLKKTDEDEGLISIEQSSKGVKVCGKEKYRVTAHGWAGGYAVLTDYSSDVKAYSTLNDRYNEYVCDGEVYSDKIAVTPFEIERSIYYDSFNEVRKSFVHFIATRQMKEGVIYDYSGVSPYLYKSADGFVLILVNTTLSTLKEISFTLNGVKFNKLFEINRKGDKVEKRFNTVGNRIKIHERFENLSTKTFIFE